MSALITTNRTPAVVSTTLLRTNRLLNPSGRVSTTGYSSIGAGATVPTLDAGNDTYTISTTVGVLPGNLGILMRTLTIGVELLANTDYVFSCDVRAYLAPATAQAARLYAIGAGVASGGTATVASAFAWSRASASFRTAASGVVNFYVMNGSTTVAGSNVVMFRDAMVEETTVLGTYFDGATADTYDIDYVWVGAANNSRSQMRQNTRDSVQSTAPELITGYSSSSSSRNVVHELLGGGVSMSLVAADPRSGELEMLYLTESAARDCEVMHSKPATFTLVHSDRPSLAMTYALPAGGTIQRTLDPRTRRLWLVRVGFLEVMP